MFVQLAHYVCLPPSFANEVTQAKRGAQQWAAQLSSAFLCTQILL